MIQPVSRLFRLAAVVLGPALCASAPLADSQFVERYVGAVRLARAGRPEAALDQLAPLARENPSSVPVHRAVARLALATGAATTWEERFRARLRRSSRDEGAAVGLAVLESAQGHLGEARRLLLDAVTAGARDPLLVPLLVASHQRPEELIGWLAARASVLPGDGRFTALHARVLVALDRLPDARAVLERGLLRDPGHPEMLAVHAELLAAAGEAREACTEAAAVAPRLAGEQRVPELRVPARLALARIQVRCGGFDEAARLLRTTGPAVAFPGDPSLPQQVTVVEAELAVARENPLQALAILAERGGPPEDDPHWGEAATSVRCRGLALLGLAVPDAAQIIARPVPRGLALADRSVALAALATTIARGETGLQPALHDTADALDRAGLRPRAARTALLARALGVPAEALNALPSASAPVRQVEPGADAPGGPGWPELAVARALVEARAALGRGDRKAALAAAAVDPVAADGAPGPLLAALGVVTARAALADGETQRAAAAVRESLLDIEAGNRARAPLPPELEPIAGPPTEVALELAGLGFRSAIAARRPPGQAAEELLRNLGRIVHGWSTLEVPWPATLAEIARIVPSDGCLVVTTAGADGPALAIDRKAAFAVAPIADVAASPPCAPRRRILWAGPGAPPGGLIAAPDDERVIVRLVVPAPLPRPVPRRVTPPPVRGVGAGTDRPLRGLVESLAGVTQDPAEPRTARFDPLQSWPAFRGAGIASSTAPLSSGWLAPPSGITPGGWIAPETLLTMPVSPGGGLVALGVRIVPGGPETERGAWMLAESALSGGWPWVLISRRPLAREEHGRIEQRLRYWARDPVREARRLAAEDPGLADALTLWTAPAPAPAGNRRWYALAAAMGGVGLVAAVAAIRFAVARARRQPTRLSKPPGTPPEPA